MSAKGRYNIWLTVETLRWVTIPIALMKKTEAAANNNNFETIYRITKEFAGAVSLSPIRSGTLTLRWTYGYSKTFCDLNCMFNILRIEQEVYNYLNFAKNFTRFQFIKKNGRISTTQGLLRGHFLAFSMWSDQTYIYFV